MNAQLMTSDETLENFPEKYLGKRDWKNENQYFKTIEAHFDVISCFQFIIILSVNV